MMLIVFNLFNSMCQALKALDTLFNPSNGIETILTLQIKKFGQR